MILVKSKSDYAQGLLQTFLSDGGFPGDGAFVQQRPVPLDQVLSAEQLAVFQSAHWLWLQAQADLPQPSGFLVLADLLVHLRDGVFDQLHSLHQRPMLVRVGWNEAEKDVTFLIPNSQQITSRRCFTFCVLYDSLHQDGIFSDALSHQEKTLGDSQPSHQW